MYSYIIACPELIEEIGRFQMQKSAQNFPPSFDVIFRFRML